MSAHPLAQHNHHTELPPLLTTTAASPIGTAEQKQQHRSSAAHNGPSLFAGWGVRCCQGYSKKMEDSYCVHEQLKAPLCSKGPKSAGSIEDFAIFSVFDGHGGDDVAKHCADRLHQHFIERLAASASAARLTSLVSDASLASDASSLDSAPSLPGYPPHLNIPSPPPSPCTPCTTHTQTGLFFPPTTSTTPLVAEALRASFIATDAELAGTEAGDYTGSTSVAVILTKDHICVAHCGDSRAVLQRSGSALDLTNDHKPSREDEAARIRAAGGRIVFNSGAPRVMGMLAMTRSIGDHYLRPYIIAEPEVTCLERSADDEVLLIATDGLWDMFNRLEATNLASRCIIRCRERGMSKHGACRVASNVLVKAAMERGSRDNITVVVVLLCDGDLVVSGGGAGGKVVTEDGVEQAAAAAAVGEKCEDGGAAVCSGKYVMQQQKQRQLSPCMVCCECTAESSSGGCSDVGEEWEEREEEGCEAEVMGIAGEGQEEVEARQPLVLEGEEGRRAAGSGPTGQEAGGSQGERTDSAELLGSSAPVSLASAMASCCSLGLGLGSSSPRLDSLSMGVDEPSCARDARLELALGEEQRGLDASNASSWSWSAYSIP